jgi:hypothetical protein
MAMRREIIARRETVKIDNRGQLQRFVVFEYMLDNFGPFTYEEDKRTFTYDHLKADMAKEEKGLASIEK